MEGKVNRRKTSLTIELPYKTAVLLREVQSLTDETEVETINRCLQSVKDMHYYDNGANVNLSNNRIKHIPLDF